MSLFWNIFASSDKKKPVVNGFSISWLDARNEATASRFFEFYEQNPYIQSVIGRIQGDVWANGFEIRIGEKVNKNALKEWKYLLKASIWYNPRQFVKRLTRDFEVTGNAYVYKAKDWNKVTGLQILDPRYMKPIMKADWTLIGYLQNLGWYRYFTRDEIAHLRWDTDLKYEALWRSKMQSLFIDLETDSEARDSNLSFFKNNQTPASAIILNDDTTLGDGEDADKMRKKFKEVLESGIYTGGKNRHRASVWEGVKEVIKLQDKITDMEFVNVRKFTLEMVCAVYEVPKDMLWLTEDSNRSVWGTQSENYYFRINEKENQLDEFLTEIVQEAIWEQFSYTTLKDNLRLLSVKAKIAWDLYKTGLLTRNESREVIQYAPDGTEKWGEYFTASKSNSEDTQKEIDTKDEEKSE